MQNFQIESSFSSEKFCEPGLYQLQWNNGTTWFTVSSSLATGCKNIEYLAEYPISEFELREIFSTLCRNVDLTNGDVKIRRIPHEFKTTSEEPSQESSQRGEA